MIVGLISDTHDNLPMVEKALKLFQRESVECVVHAGDWVAPFTARKFDVYAGKLYGSYGNNDGEVLGLSRIFKEMNAVVRGEFTEVELDGDRMAVIHGTYPSVVDAVVASARFPTVVSGHSHMPVIERKPDVLLVNPGEACGYLYGRATVAVLDTADRQTKIHELR